MSFSWRISLFVVFALLISMITQSVLSFWLFRQALNEDLHQDLERYMLIIEQGIIQSDQGLSLDSDALSVVSEFSAYANGRARLLDSRDQPLLLVGGIFPEDTSNWFVLKRSLPSGLKLEAVMNTRAHNVALNDYLKVNLFTLILLLISLGVLGFVLTIRLLKPIRNLQQSVSEVSNSADLSSRVKVGKRDDELSRLAQSYNRMMEKLEAYFERERLFTRYASHELRNPVTALRLQTDAALAGTLPVANVLPTLKRELQRISNTLDSLLVLARDQLNLKEVCNLTQIVSESVDRARLLAADTSLFITFNQTDEVYIKGDHALLARMIDNLLENAIKYSPAGEIIVHLHKRADEIKLAVEDQGPGVAKEHLAKLSTPFYRASPKKNGAGLGLAVVQHIARAHGATLKFTNLPSTGFEVSLSFPSKETL